MRYRITHQEAGQAPEIYNCNTLSDIAAALERVYSWHGWLDHQIDYEVIQSEICLEYGKQYVRNIGDVLQYWIKVTDMQAAGIQKPSLEPVRSFEAA